MGSSMDMGFRSDPNNRTPLQTQWKYRICCGDVGASRDVNSGIVVEPLPGGLIPPGMLPIPDSLFYVDEGRGLGMMWGNQKAVEMLEDAGFTQVEVLEIPTDSFNSHFFCRR